MTGRADPDTLRRILAYESWAVVGLGDDPSKAAYGVAAFLAAHGKRIIPVHPRATEVLGQPVFRTLAEIPEPVDVVDVFRRSEQAGRFADEAVALGAKAVWFQLGIVDEEAYARTTAAGLDMVMDTCPKIEWGQFGSR
jgi:hypothetical protein